MRRDGHVLFALALAALATTIQQLRFAFFAVAVPFALLGDKVPDVMGHAKEAGSGRIRRRAFTHSLLWMAFATFAFWYSLRYLLGLAAAAPIPPAVSGAPLLSEASRWLQQLRPPYEALPTQAFALGFLSHLIVDSLTESGVALAYPFPGWFGIGLSLDNPWLRVAVAAVFVVTLAARVYASPGLLQALDQFRGILGW